MEVETKKPYGRFTKAFTALLVGSIMAIMIGSVLLVVSYTVINAIILGTATSGGNISLTNVALCNSFSTQITNITSALNIAGIGLIIAGIAGIVYMLIGLGGVSGRGRY